MPVRRRGIIHVDGAAVEAHYLFFVHEELRLYPRRRRELAAAEDDVARATGENEMGMPRTPGVGNPTPGRALTLADDERVNELRGLVVWIDDVYALLDERTKLVLDELVVFGLLTANGVADKHYMGVATVYRERNRGLLALALRYFGERILIGGTRQRRRNMIVLGGSEVVKLL